MSLVIGDRSNHSSNPRDGQLERLNGRLEEYDSSQNAWKGIGGVTNFGQFNNIPTTLNEGEIYVVTKDEGGTPCEPGIWVGPPGGGNPKPLNRYVKVFLDLTSREFKVESRGAGWPPISVGTTYSLNEQSTGVFEGSTSLGDYSKMQNVSARVLAADRTNNQFLDVYSQIQSDGTVRVEVRDPSVSRISTMTFFQRVVMG
jgi:hypothetical protein